MLRFLIYVHSKIAKFVYVMVNNDSLQMQALDTQLIYTWVGGDRILHLAAST